MATVGHEGHVYYFVYDRERDWEDRLNRAGMFFAGSGESEYLRIFKTAGMLGGTE